MPVPIPEFPLPPAASRCRRHAAYWRQALVFTLVWSAGLLAACGSRSLLTNDSADGGPQRDAVPQTSDSTQVPDLDQPRGDGAISGSCARMEAGPDPLARCSNPIPIGWAWNGELCVSILCGCAGADCDSLYPTEADCYQQRAPLCLPPPACLDLPYDQCEAHPACQRLYFGGGCIDLDACDPDGPNGGLVCWERAVACLPHGQPCNERGQSECTGECFWWEKASDELCVGDSGAAECCVSERYGYCASIPRADSCQAQEVGQCLMDCADTVGYFWDGTFCRPISCCCVGPDCGQTYLSAESCALAHQDCT